MNNAVFGNIMENVRKHRGIKFVTTERRRNYLVSEANYHTTNFFTEHLLALTSILELSKISYQFWYDYVKTRFGKKAKLSYMDTNGFIVYIKHKTIDLLKNHIYSKNKAFWE